MPRPAREIRVGFAGERRALAARTVRRVVTAVLDGEGVGDATVSVTFVSAAKMRTMNRRAFGHDRSTDVIAYPLPHGTTLVGDVYICPAVARRSARRHGLTAREELVRLVIHGTLHVAGRDHPAAAREGSSMWRRQERYVRVLSTARG